MGLCGNFSQVSCHFGLVVHHLSQAVNISLQAEAVRNMPKPENVNAVR